MIYVGLSVSGLAPRPGPGYTMYTLYPSSEGLMTPDFVREIAHGKLDGDPAVGPRHIGFGPE